eukprot:4750685-Prymnesium_polylepis.1
MPAVVPASSLAAAGTAAAAAQTSIPATAAAGTLPRGPCRWAQARGEPPTMWRRVACVFVCTSVDTSVRTLYRVVRSERVGSGTGGLHGFIYTLSLCRPYTIESSIEHRSAPVSYVTLPHSLVYSHNSNGASRIWVHSSVGRARRYFCPYPLDTHTCWVLRGVKDMTISFL